MKSITYGDSTLRSQMRCSLFGHKFQEIKPTGAHREFKCIVCHVHATNDEATNAPTLAEEFRQINRDLLSRHHRTTFSL